MGVVVEVDARLFPMEIAKRMLALGVALSMDKGPTAYFEAEKELVGFLDSLSIYHKVIWPALRGMDYRLQQRAVVRYIEMRRTNPNLIDSKARALLDFMSFFPAPVAEEDSHD